MKHPVIRYSVLPLCLSLSMLSACDKQQTSSSDSVDSTLGEKTSILLNNAKLTARVKTALAADAGLQTVKLNVDSENGIVTICGKVPDQAMQQAITRVATGVEGVVLVNNHVMVEK